MVGKKELSYNITSSIDFFMFGGSALMVSLRKMSIYTVRLWMRGLEYSEQNDAWIPFHMTVIIIVIFLEWIFDSSRSPRH